jgi:orotidine-5'-phosphate decarboxylase
LKGEAFLYKKYAAPLKNDRAGIYFIFSMKKPADYIAVALDNLQELRHIEKLVDQTREYCSTYKIGLELFTRMGPSILECIRRSGRDIFLDLKFHDIPNTVAQAVASAALLGVRYCTVHAQGGKSMMAAAAAAAQASREKGIEPPKIIAVTVLTSIDAPCLRDELNVRLSLEDQVQSLAGLAVSAGMDGIVCSAADLYYVRKSLPESFTIITPGIRRAGSDVHDQKRTASPREALSGGATMLVLGREVTSAESPQTVLQEIIADISSVSGT